MCKKSIVHCKAVPVSREYCSQAPGLTLSVGSDKADILA